MPPLALTDCGVCLALLCLACLPACWLGCDEVGAHWYLAMLGDGPQRDEYARLHGALHGVFFEPQFVSQQVVAQHYCAADAYVSGSRRPTPRPAPPDACSANACSANACSPNACSPNAPPRSASSAAHAQALRTVESTACATTQISGSEFETLGFGAIEAMACGTPALVPDSQGFGDTVQHGVTGYLFRPRDLDDAEAGALCLAGAGADAGAGGGGGLDREAMLVAGKVGMPSCLRDASAARPVLTGVEAVPPPCVLATPISRAAAAAGAGDDDRGLRTAGRGRVPPPRHKYPGRNSELTEICLRF
jgi:hypothetical protein